MGCTARMKCCRSVTSLCCEGDNGTANNRLRRRSLARSVSWQCSACNTECVWNCTCVCFCSREEGAVMIMWTLYPLQDTCSHYCVQCRRQFCVEQSNTMRGAALCSSKYMEQRDADLIFTSALMTQVGVYYHLPRVFFHECTHLRPKSSLFQGVSLLHGLGFDCV